MINRYETSPFSDPAAVETWDTWFRWREGGRLRDLSIEATWQRVAKALAAVEETASARWGQRFIDAQAGWQLLFDERILASAGTDHADWPDAPVAVLNAAQFVDTPYMPNACFDFAAFGRIAELAVRGLDNALLAVPRPRQTAELRIGMIGVADAFAFLGMDYDSTKARAVAGSMAQALAEACLRASVCLACERGACADTDALLAASKARGMPTELLADASRRGLRHQKLTAITSQRRLALLANNVTDALDPLPSDTRTRQPRSPGYALTVARQYVTQDFARDLLSKAPAAISVAAQRELRGAVQPWTDVPIDYELRAISEPLVLLPKSSSPSTETNPVG